MRGISCWQSVAMHAILPTMDLDTRILIVDDDAGIRTLMSSFLAKHGFITETAGNPHDMRSHLMREHYDLVVLDVMMPKEDGLSALRSLQGDDAPPVIMLSAVGSDIDRIVGLEMGAEDYLAKPCNPRELLARIRTVLRRRQKSAPMSDAANANAPVREGMSFSGWTINLDARLLYDPEDRLISLTDGEFRLLKAFVEHPRRVLTRDQLLDFARGEESEHYDRAIDVQISRLRRKLSDGQSGGDLIRTVRNEGYLFVAAVTKG